MFPTGNGGGLVCGRGFWSLHRIWQRSRWAKREERKRGWLARGCIRTSASFTPNLAPTLHPMYRTERGISKEVRCREEVRTLPQN